jgi:hypothetical protein
VDRNFISDFENGIIVHLPRLFATLLNDFQWGRTPACGVFFDAVIRDWLIRFFKRRIENEQLRLRNFLA